MNIQAARAIWEVSAGLIPGTRMNEYTRRFGYTSLDYETDGHQRDKKFFEVRQEAHEYARALEAGGLNWVRVDYIWL